MGMGAGMIRSLRDRDRARRTAILSAIFIAACLTAGPAPAESHFLDSPCGSGTTYGVEVSGDSWLARCSGGMFVTSDAGNTWKAVDFAANEVATDGEGRFYAAIGVTLDRLNGRTGVVERVFPSPGMSDLAFDPSGTLWGARCTDPSRPDGGAWSLWRFDLNARAVTQVAQGGACTFSEDGHPRSYDHPLHVDSDGRVFIVESPSTRLVVDSGTLVSVPLPPFAVSAGATLSEGGVGGEGWTLRRDVQALPGHPNYAVFPGYYAGLVRNFAEGMWAPTGRQWAATVSGGVLLPAVDGRRLEFVGGPLDAALLLPGDPQPTDSADMINEANRMRAAVGLLPLIGDAKIAQAAHNHSVYWTLNQSHGSSHWETPGTPGFTGADPSERCAAVGAVCGAEVMYSGMEKGSDAVQGWIATAFHRGLLMNSGVYRVGGGLALPGPAVMDAAGSLWSAPVGKPFGYPRGTYTGPLSYSGEIPDPASYCSARSISAPFGTAISIQLPGLSDDAPDHVSVREVGGHEVAGCLLSQMDEFDPVVFQPDDALRPATTYEATATWQGNHPDLHWTFTTGNRPDDRAAPARRKPSIRLRVSAHKNRLLVDAGPDTRGVVYRVTLQRLHKRQWRQYRILSLRGQKHRKSVHSKSGIYRAVAHKQAGLRGAKSRIVRIK